MENIMKQIECIIYDRCVGYFSPVFLTANPGKKEEIRERKRMSIKNIAEALKKLDESE